MLRLALVSSNSRIMNKVAMHLINNHNFSNYTLSSLNQYTQYVYPNVNTYGKYLKLKDMNFKFIKIINTNHNSDLYPFIIAQYTILNYKDTNEIINQVEHIINRERLNEMHSIYC
jgi:hypothetical protein